MDDLDTEQFIEEVKKRTAIWDSSSDDYKNRDLKKNQWAEVCMVLYPDFLGLDANDRLRTGTWTDPLNQRSSKEVQVWGVQL